MKHLGYSLPYHTAELVKELGKMSKSAVCRTAAEAYMEIAKQVTDAIATVPNVLAHEVSHEFAAEIEKEVQDAIDSAFSHLAPEPIFSDSEFDDLARTVEVKAENAGFPFKSEAEKRADEFLQSDGIGDTMSAEDAINKAG